MTDFLNPEEVNSIEKFTFARKEDYQPVQNKDLTIATNFFKFNLSNKSCKTYFKYDVAFQPEIPGDAQKMRRQAIRKAKPQLEEKLGHFLFNSTMLYARENVNDVIEVEIELDEQKYIIVVTWVQAVQNDSFEAQSVYKKYFFNMVNNLKYVQLKKNFFNPKAARVLKEHNVEIWCGFNPTISLMQNQVLLNLNVVNRVIRFESALELLNKLSNSKEHGNIKEAIDSTFKGLTVVTRYNGDKTYTLEGVDLEKNPSDCFETKDGKVSYAEYYQKKYNKKINSNQPLLVHKDRKGDIIHLIPELCFLTGLTEEMRANFQLMSKMAEVTKGNPKIKVEESLSLLQSIKDNDQCQKDISKWGITVEEKPLVISGKKINAGNLELGKRVTVDIENTQDLDRQIQKQMFTQPKISDWAVIFNSRDSKTIDEFIRTLGDVKKTFNFEAVELRKIPVNSPNFEEWRKAVYNNTSPNTQMLICAIPGNRQKGALYKDLKKLLVNTLPIPSQFILTGTMTRPKGFRSVVNKLLIQISSKVGGEPWAINQLPFTNAPTMICSFDIKSDLNLLSFVATYNNTFTKYIPLTRVGSDYSKNLSECMQKSVESFFHINKVPIKHIIIFREGLSKGQMEKEVSMAIPAFKKGFASFGLTKEQYPKLTYIYLSKKINTKLFNFDKNNYSNCSPGTIVDDVITEKDKIDFYLISQKTTQGVAQPTHYYLAYDEMKVELDQLYTLIYKLSYLYYNWSGSIRVPSPCQYAKKLLILIGEKLSDKREVVVPKEDFENRIQTLYFI